MAVWTVFWKRRESLALWVQGVPQLLSSGTQNSPCLFNFTLHSHHSHCLQHLGLPLLSTVPSTLHSRNWQPASVEHLKLCTEPHTPLLIHLPGFGNVSKSDSSRQNPREVLSSPISRELLTSVETALTHKRILILFRDTLELKSP